MEQNSDSYFTAYGLASDIPILLRRLLSKDLEGSFQALSELYNNVLHQGIGILKALDIDSKVFKRVSAP